jgi:hypothetical protein
MKTRRRVGIGIIVARVGVDAGQISKGCLQGQMDADLILRSKDLHHLFIVLNGI